MSEHQANIHQGTLVDEMYHMFLKYENTMKELATAMERQCLEMNKPTTKVVKNDSDNDKNHRSSTSQPLAKEERGSYVSDNPALGPNGLESQSKTRTSSQNGRTNPQQPAGQVSPDVPAPKQLDSCKFDMLRDA
ncbi:hypothetical protein H4R24_002296 [Coemansia sp. RSA 988]|nr:hypothetical protein H4R24_002296 [Coemansia sp. RSA 988]